MIRHFLAFLRRTRRQLAPARLAYKPARVCRVQTDLTDCVVLHAGDLLCIEPAHVGYNICALVLRNFLLQSWVLFHCPTLREAYGLRDVLERALQRGASHCNPRTELDGELARRVRQEEALR